MGRSARGSGRRIWMLVAMLAVVLLGSSAIGCRRASSVRKSATGAGSVRLLITRDFGTRVLADKSVKLTGSPSVMAILKKNAKVETAYGGGFVNSISGLSSGYTGGGSSKYDWFYFVNGVQASVGAADYKVRDGDRIWWDYHSWSFAASIPAVVGSYPEPFAHGFEGRTVPIAVVYADGFAHDAGTLRDGLLRAGAKKVTLEPLRPGLPRPADRSLMLVGTWKQVGTIDWVKDASDNPGTSGLFVTFKGGEALMYDCTGRPSDSQRRAGAVMATGEAGQPSVAWILTGVDEAAVRRAVTLVVKEPASLANKFGVVIDEDNNAIGVPRAGT